MAIEGMGIGMKACKEWSTLCSEGEIGEILVV